MAKDQFGLQIFRLDAASIKKGRGRRARRNEVVEGRSRGMQTKETGRAPGAPRDQRCAGKASVSVDGRTNVSGTGPDSKLVLQLHREKTQNPPPSPPQIVLNGSPCRLPCVLVRRGRPCHRLKNTMRSACKRSTRPANPKQTHLQIQNNREDGCGAVRSVSTWPLQVGHFSLSV